VSTNKRVANANTSMSMNMNIVNGNINTIDVNVSIRMTIVNGKRRILALAKKRRKSATTRWIIPRITSVKAVFVIY